MEPEKQKLRAFEQLRQRAEKVLQQEDNFEVEQVLHDLNQLAYELQISQTELEIQNQELQESHLRLDHAKTEFFDLFDLAPVGILSLNHDLEVLRLNKAARSWFGDLTEVSPTGHFLQMILPDHRGPFVYFVDQIFKDEGPEKLEFQVRRRDGTPMWVSAAASRPAGRWVHLAFEDQVCMLSLTDITPLKNIQVELQRSEEHSRAILETMEDSLFVVSREGFPEIINPAACRLFGYGRQKMRTLPVTRLLAPSESGMYETISEEIRRRGAFSGETIIRRASGRLVTVSVNCSRFDHEDKHRSLWLLRDIQEQVENERELRRAAAVYQQTSEGILMANGNLEIVSANAAAEQICGFTSAELLGKDLFCLNADRSLPDRQTILAELQAKGKWSGEVSQRRAGGENYLALLSLVLVSDRQSRDRQYLAVFHDLTPHRRAEQRIRQLAHFDDLTELPNRALFLDRLDQALTHARRSGTWVALLFLDLDNFKAINDSLGHLAGDVLLQEVARRLSQSVRDEDTVSRMGGDEFTLLLGHFQEELPAQRTAVRLANSILEALEGPVPYQEHEMFTNASIGVAMFPRDAEKAEDLLRCADTAMYAAKKGGRGTFQFFSRSLDQEAKNRMALEVGLRRALTRGEFLLHYQPQVQAADEALVGLEALIRWKTASGKILSPGHFIPVAEESGLIVQMGAWVLEEACRQGARLRAAGLDPGRIAVNMSSRELARPDFMKGMQETLARTGFAPEGLEIEVCERVFQWDLEKSSRLLASLRELGITVALDDFGTGYSSLQYLKALPIDKLKIDRSFVINLESSEQDQGIVRTIIELGRSIGLTVVAEGVERASQARWLADHGCHQFQGFHFGRATDPAEIRRALPRRQLKRGGQA